MALSQHPASRVEGVVERINERGLQLAGGDGWLNFSKYGPDVPRPLRGQRVAVQVKGGWIQSLEVLTSTQVDAAATQIDLSSQHALTTNHGVSRDRTITRLAVLKAAAQFAASRPDAKSTDVLAIADRWLPWVLAEGDGSGKEA